jgi:hypothetical protein
MFTHPTWLEVVNGDLYVVDRMNQRIRRIAADGNVTTVTPVRDFPTPAQTFPIDFGSAFGGGIVAEPAGCGGDIYGPGMFVAGSGQEQIVLVSPNGSLSSRDAYPVIIGSGKSGARDGIFINAQFHTPTGLARAERGTPGVAGSDDTHLNAPSGIDLDANGSVYVVDTFNHAIRRIAPDGKLVTVAGRLGASGFADGDAAAAKFNAPVGLKIAPDGSLFVADTGNNVIRKVTLNP